MFQVNIHYDFISDEYSCAISEYSEDGYKGRLTDTVYEGGISYTDWCSFTGTYEECEEFIDEFMSVNGKE